MFSNFKFFRKKACTPPLSHNNLFKIKRFNPRTHNQLCQKHSKIEDTCSSFFNEDGKIYIKISNYRAECDDGLYRLDYWTGYKINKNLSIKTVTFSVSSGETGSGPIMCGHNQTELPDNHHQCFGGKCCQFMSGIRMCVCPIGHAGQNCNKLNGICG